MESDELTAVGKLSVFALSRHGKGHPSSRSKLVWGTTCTWR